MFFRVRPAQPEDLPRAFRFIQKIFRASDAESAGLQAMWKEAMQEADCCANVTEDSDRPESERVVSLGIVFCVPETLLDYARSEAPPFAWRWTLERWRRGEKIWLPRAEARRIQLQGPVSVLAFLVADAFSYDRVALGLMGNIFSEASIRDLAAFRMRHFFTEAQGTAQRDRFVGHGMSVLNDYHRHQEHPAFAALPPEYRPVLMGADLSKIAQDVSLHGTSLGRAALVGSPRYAFSEPEQEVMRTALLGLTDQSIAEKLGLSLSTIKKRWEGIYEKVDEQMFQKALNEEGDNVAKTRRRQVLQMVAEHPEEFRPSPPKKRPPK